MAENPSVPPGNIHTPLVLAIDIGTSSVRSALFDTLGRLVEGSLARREVNLLTSPEGKAVIEADSLLDSVWACIDETLSLVGIQDERIAGVGCCTFVSNILGVDQHRRAATPIFTYADTRPAGEAALLKEKLDEAAAHQRTGCMFHPSYLPARFLWLAKSHPEWLSAGYSWVTVGEYLALKLFGETAVSYSAASWSGLLNRFALDWDSELLSALPLDRSSFSTLVDADHSWRGLREPFSARWPALRDVPWFAAIGDGAAANLGSGCTDSNRAALTMGSTSAMRVILRGELPSVPQGLWSYRVDKDSTLLGGALSEGGNILAWACEALRIDPAQDLEGMLADSQARDHGLVFLPLLAGERSPGWRGEARGMIAGLSLATQPVDILVAALEGVALRLALVYDLLKPELPAGHSVIANGGALVRSPGWMQIIADVLGCVVTLSGVEEASARGAAMLALHSLGLARDLRDFPAFTGREFSPDPKRHELYQKAKARQQQLYGFI